MMKFNLFLILLLVLNHFKVSAQKTLIDIPDESIVAALDSAYNCHINKGENCEAIYLFAIKKGKQLRIKYDDYLNFSYANYLSAIGKTAPALAIIDSVLPLSKNDTVIDALLNSKAAILYNQGFTEDAVTIFIKLAERFEARGDQQKLAYIYLNIGVVLGSENNFQGSVDFLLKSHEVMKTYNDSILVITLRANIAAAFYDLKKYEKAKLWAQESIETPVKSARDENGKIIANRILANIYKQTNTDSALVYIKRSVEIANKLNNKAELAGSYVNYAEILEATGNYRLAQYYIDKTIAMSRENIFMPGLAKSLLLAGKISIKNSEFEKAANYLLEANTLNDSIKTENNFRIVNELTTKYETEKKERKLAESRLEIEQKNKQIRTWTITAFLIVLSALFFIFQIRRNQKTKLKILLHETENELLKAQVRGEEIERGRVSKELHDGVASSLLVTRLQLDKNTETSNENAKNMIKDIHKEIRNIAHKLNPIDFNQKNWINEVNNYCANIETQNTTVHFFSNIEQLNLDPTRSLVLFRSIQELLQNAIKHAAANSISVQIVSDEDSLQISVEDDGKGAYQELIDEAESLSNLKRRLKDIGAELCIETKVDEGLLAVINFDYNANKSK